MKGDDDFERYKFKYVGSYLKIKLLVKMVGNLI